MFEDEIINNQKDIILIIRERWSKGLKPDGSIIGEYKSESYKRRKTLLNPTAGGNVDLTLSGDLQKSLVVTPSGNDIFAIGSHVKYWVFLAEEYGIENFGITKEQEVAFMQEVSFRVNKKIQTEISKI